MLKIMKLMLKKWCCYKKCIGSLYNVNDGEELEGGEELEKEEGEGEGEKGEALEREEGEGEGEGEKGEDSEKEEGEGEQEKEGSDNE